MMLRTTSSRWNAFTRVWRSFLYVVICAPVLLGCVKKKSISEDQLGGTGTTTTGFGTDGGTTTTGIGVGVGTGLTSGSGTTTSGGTGQIPLGDGSILSNLPTISNLGGSSKSGNPFPLTSNVGFGFPVKGTSTQVNFDGPTIPPDIKIVNEISGNNIVLSNGTLTVSDTSGPMAMANLNFSLRNVYLAARIQSAGMFTSLFTLHHVSKRSNSLGNHCYMRCSLDSAGNLQLSEDIGGSLSSGTSAGGQVYTVNVGVTAGIMEMVTFENSIACQFTNNSGQTTWVGARRHIQPEESRYLFGVQQRGSSVISQMAVADLSYVSKKAPITIYRNTFDGSSSGLAAELTAIGGTPSVYNGALATTSPGVPVGAMLRNTIELADYELSADVRVRASGSHASLVLRYQNGYYYSVKLENGVSAQYVKILYHTPSAVHELSSIPINDSLEEMYQFDMSGNFRLGARIVGNQIRAYLNSQMIGTASPSHLGRGAPGFIFDAPGSAGIDQVGLDNFRVDAVGR